MTLTMINSLHAGFRCGEHENPADFILDVLTTCEKSVQANEVAVAIDTGETNFQSE